MVVKFERAQVIEYYEKELESTGKAYEHKNYSKIIITLTKDPADNDKKEPGFNPGFDSKDIKEELSE